MPPDNAPKDTHPVWSRLHLWQIQWVRDVLIVLIVLGLFWIGQAISIVTVPLLLALLLAYLFEPVIQWIMAHTRIGRPGAVSAIIASIVLVVLVPSAIGISYGLFQAVGIVGLAADKLEVVWSGVDAGRAAAAAQQRLDEALALRARAANADESATGDGALPPDAAALEGHIGAQPSSPPTTQPDDDNGFLWFGDDDEPAPPPRDVPTEADIALLEKQADQAQLAATKARQRVVVEAPRWLDLHDYLIAQHEEGSIDEGLQSLQRWVTANAEQIAGAAAITGVSVVGRTLSFLAGALGLLFMCFLTAFFFFFMSTGWVQVKDLGVKLMPTKNRDLIIHLMVEFDRVISAFIRGRLTIAFIQAIFFTIAYTIIGVPASFILGPIVAILSIVPYLALIGVPISIVLLWLEGHTGIRGTWLWILLAPTVVYFIGQFLDDYVWTPRIQGKSTDMSTPMILFASLAGGVLLGFFGLLIAIPIAACLKILIQEVFWPRFKAWTEGKEEDFLPISRDGE